MSGLALISESNFKVEVLDSTVPVVVEFGADWCQPCMQLEPVLRQLGDQWAGKVRMVQVNVDDSLSLTETYGVMSVPTVILFVQGQPKERLTGYKPKAQLMAKFEPHLR
jgi:thioredoxin 1